MKVIYLNVEEKRAPLIMDIVDELDELKRLINCEAIDITRRYIGLERRYLIICDDEGILKSKPLSAIPSREGWGLAGNLIICGNEDHEGELTSLSDEDTQWILRFFRQWGDRYILTVCDA